MRGFVLLTLVAIAAALPKVPRKTCDFSQVASNPSYGSTTDKPVHGNQFCDYNFVGNFASFHSCGGEQPNGEVYPACDTTYNEMMK